MKINKPSLFSKRIGFISSGFAAVMLFSGCAGNPPTAEMALAKASVINATAAGGTEFAPLPLRAAMDKMEGAEQAMGSPLCQNSCRLKFFKEIKFEIRNENLYKVF